MKHFRTSLRGPKLALCALVVAGLAGAAGCVETDDDTMTEDGTSVSARAAICTALEPCLTTEPYCGVDGAEWQQLLDIYLSHDCY